MRVLKPGGHMAVFAGARTQDLMGLSIRLAGFEIRDTLGWIYGSGFPKSMDISKAIDKAAGAEREVVGSSTNGIAGGTGEHTGEPGSYGFRKEFNITTPATSEAAKWDGWGTALKPAIEPIILARKPLDGTVAQNVLAHGVGGLNIDASRVGNESRINLPAGNKANSGGVYKFSNAEVDAFNGAKPAEVAGRFPANVLLDEHTAKEMDEQSGVLKGRVGMTKHGSGTNSVYGTYERSEQSLVNDGRADSGGASRFFPVFKYQAKAPKRERPVLVREDGTKVQHPTVKPLALMEWLVTLITPEGGTILDPFAGTGTTLQAATNRGFHSIGIEADADYIQLINKRMEGGEQSTRNN